MKKLLHVRLFPKFVFGRMPLFMKSDKLIKRGFQSLRLCDFLHTDSFKGTYPFQLATQLMTIFLAQAFQVILIRSRKLKNRSDFKVRAGTGVFVF